jgi:ubiquinone/menaquinone biosynthesis C-methylase UbiE
MRTIELGGGNNPQYRPNYDIRPLPNVDRVIDLNGPLPVPDNSYDLVYSRYFVEHVSYRNVDNLFREMYRILVPAGNLVIITANLFEQAKVLLNTTQWNHKLISMIFGDQNYNENAHQCGFSPEYITRILKNIGFKDIKIEPIYTEVGPTDMTIQAVKE